MKKRCMGIAWVLLFTSALFAKGEKEVTPVATSEQKQTLVVAIQTDPMVTEYANNYFTQYLEDKLGCNIEFYELPNAAEDIRTAVSLMASSTKGLPDVLITRALTNETIFNYGANDIIIPLNDYLDDPKKMPNYCSQVSAEDKEMINAAMKMADGKIYAFPQFEPETWNLTTNRYFINKAWLDKLGLEIPKTTDELENVLIAFRDKDPNGNGKKDELGIVGYTNGGYGQNVVAALMNSFEFWNGGTQNGGLALSSDGKTVIAPFTQEGWKKGLKYLHKLYDEGLLSPSVFTDEDSQFRATVNQTPNVVGLLTIGSLSNYPSASSGNNQDFNEMQLVEPFTGPEGICYTPFTSYVPSQAMFIFSTTDKKDLAIKFADEFFDPYTGTIARFGKEGTDWTKEPEFLAKQTNSFIAEGLYDAPSLAYISNYWWSKTNVTWHDINPRYASLEETNRVVNGQVPFNVNDPTQLNAKCYKMYFTKHPTELLPLLKYTIDETDSISSVLSDVPEYVNQSLAEFITGARDIDKDWNAYLSELDNLGLSSWLSIAQTAYDRIK